MTGRWSPMIEQAKRPRELSMSATSALVRGVAPSEMMLPPIQ
nr:hypothetical protein [Nocardia zapadnayensis]